MTYKYEKEIKANLERAATSIQAAKVLLTNNYYDLVASRTYGDWIKDTARI